MQMYPRLFPQHRIRNRFRQAEWRVFQTLAHSGAPGFAYYEWQRRRRDPPALQLDFALWLEGIGRFGLQVKGGHHILQEGVWYRRKGRRGGNAQVSSCPLGVTSDSTMSLLNEVVEALDISTLFIPVLIFPDMKPDEAISKRAERSNVHIIWREESLPDRLAEIAREVGVWKPPYASDIRREVAIITDGQITYGDQPDGNGNADSGGNPAAPAALSTGPDLVFPHVRRVEVHLAPGCGNPTSKREVRRM